MSIRVTRSQSTMQTTSPISALFEPGAEITCKDDLVKIVGNADLHDVLFALVVANRVSATRVGELEERVTQLEEEVGSLKESLQHRAELEDRVLRQEAYSGRNTIVLAGVPVAENETPQMLESTVTSVLQKALPSFKPQDIGICHRNGKARGKSRPPTVTLVVTKAKTKDAVMTKTSRDKMKSGAKVAAYHRMSPGLRSRKQELESVPGVKFVAFSGHRLFTVCLSVDNREVYVKNVINKSDLTQHNN